MADDRVGLAGGHQTGVTDRHHGISSSGPSHGLYGRTSSLAPTEVDLSTATSDLNTPLLGSGGGNDSAGTPTPGGGPGYRVGRVFEEPETDSACDIDIYNDPRTPYFCDRDQTVHDQGRHGWLHPNPGTKDPATTSRLASYKAATSSGVGLGRTSSIEGSGEGFHQKQAVPLTRISPNPDKFVKAFLTAGPPRPQRSTTSSPWGSAASLDVMDPSTYPHHLYQQHQHHLSSTGHKLSRKPGSSTSLAGDTSSTGMGIGLGLKAMASGSEGRVVVAGNETLRVLRIVPPLSPGETHPYTSSQTSNQTTSRSSKRANQPVRLSSGPGGYTIEHLSDLWKTVGGTSSKSGTRGTRGGGSDSGLKSSTATGSAGGGPGGGKIINAVDWGVGAMSNKILTAGSSGTFLIFDVQRGGFEREVTGGSHTRSMLSLRMHKCPSQGYRVLTGGADGTAKLWDIRQSTSQGPIISIRHPSPIVSVAFPPPGLEHSGAFANAYLLGLENGSIYRYDWRAGSARSVGRMTAAHGNRSVMALEWREPELESHDDMLKSAVAAATTAVDGDQADPDMADSGPYASRSGSGGWLASGGLDKTVKIWDMALLEHTGSSPIPTHILQAPNPIRRLAWRTGQGHGTEIAVLSSPDNASAAVAGSTSHRPPSMTDLSAASIGVSGAGRSPMVNPAAATAADDDIDQCVVEEARLEVWDVRRGFIPKYLLGKVPRHNALGGSVTDICWAEGEDGMALQSTYSHGAFVQHDIRLHFTPLEYVPKQAIGWSARGDLTVAMDKFEKGVVPFDDL